MPLPSALAFGLDSGTMATAHEEDEVTQPGTPADFMGPTLWLADSERFDAGHNSHMDMLHNSPLAMGIAWEQGNVYWVLDGAHSSVTRYDFAEDHGPAGTDHSDGDVSRYVEGDVKAVRGIASHMELDRETGLLYIADTGNARIAVLDINSGTRGANVAPNYDGGAQYRVDDASISTLVDGEANFLSEPSGLALHDGMVFVSNRKNGEIQAYSLDGTPRGFLDTGLKEAIGGITFDVDGRLYVIDTEENRVLRLSPQ
jgi:DNA-binding beta-propeller fold protein YncE